MLLATYASLRHRDDGQRRWLALMSAVLGFAILTRPLPSLLVALVLSVDKLLERWRADGSRSQLARDAAAYIPPLGLFLAIFLAANHLQSGSPWTSGYHDAHGSLGVLENIGGELTNSLGGALVRENAWLLGWPCSLLLLAFARIERFPRLFWALVCTGVAYRMLAPKTVVATTGPIYVTELVPWLCLASAAGVARAVSLLERLSVSAPRARVAAFIAASFVVALCAFVPVQFRDIYRGAAARAEVYQQLRDEGISRAVVFGKYFVAPESGLSWAYAPPNPWPDLRDDILFLRIPDRPDGLESAWALWRTRFADRSALLLSASGAGASVVKLDPQLPPRPSSLSKAAGGAAP
jgi:hypothetical protein